ncbi:MAG TPA: regulatory protein RecX [Cyclobacteriaceae bacterium]|jgi:regulatory protein|nr:regulatory protein RecX [Cyclobacteriaceae bacterium]
MGGRPLDQRKSVTPTEALAKIYRYCAYQERSHLEVKIKLFEYGLRSGEVDEILSRLITEGFLNEERYARAFAGGRFRMMKWGKLKIQRELEMAGLTPKCIARGLTEIDQKDYLKTLTGLIRKKSAQTSETDLFKKKNKLARFAIGKGYEPDLVWDVIREVFD